MKVEVVEETKGGNEEENRHAETRDNFEEGNEVNVRGRVHDVLRSDVNADDARHGDAADVLDGSEPWFAWCGVQGFICRLFLHGTCNLLLRSL